MHARLTEFCLPVFVAARRTAPVTIRRFVGSATLLSGGTLLTAAHVVNGPLAEDEWLGVMFKDYYAHSDTEPGVAPIRDLMVSPDGDDIAVGRVLVAGDQHGPMLAVESLPAFGENVETWGFPLQPAPEADAQGRLIFDDFAPRYLRGYVSRWGNFKQVDGSRRHRIDVDMPAPPGLSGAPLIRMGTLEVLGIIVGESQTQQHGAEYRFAASVTAGAASLLVQQWRTAVLPKLPSQSPEAPV